MSIYEYGGPPAARWRVDDVPDQCEYSEVKREAGREHTFVCGGAPDHRCHDRRCGSHICEEHVAYCEECGNEFHNRVICLPITSDKRRVCLACSLTLEECALFGSPLTEIRKPADRATKVGEKAA